MKRKVIIVEDNIGMAQNYQILFEDAGYEAEVASTKQDAKERLRFRTFDAALVDLQLRDDITHKGGLEILEYIKQCREGTQAIVLSATSVVKETRDSYRLGALDFFMKGEAPSFDEMLKRLQDGIKKENDNHRLGGYPSLANMLSAPDKTTIWESVVSNTLGCNYEQLHTMLWSEFSTHLPILRQSDSKTSLITNKMQKAIGGLFWSKGIGSAVWFSSSNIDTALIEPAHALHGSLIQEKMYRQVKTGWWKLLNVSRNQFAEFAWETPWKNI